MNTHQLRIIVCVVLGSAIIAQSYSMMHETSVLTQGFGLSSLGLGLFIIIYGFSPDRAKQIIAEVSRIIQKSISSLFEKS